MLVKRASNYLVSGVAVLLLLGGSVGVLTAPATTRQGVDFVVSTREVPLYVKILDFLHRHYQYAALANEITQGLSSDQDRVLAVFDWTWRNIRRTPEGWPVMDDHILNIIIRGHGVGEQTADVFTTLTTYAGMLAYWRILPNGWVLSFAKIEGKWKVFDVANGLVFRNAHGDLADRKELGSNPDALVAEAAESRSLIVASRRYLSNVASGSVPQPLRAELQMPWPRLVYEVRRVVGW